MTLGTPTRSPAVVRFLETLDDLKLQVFAKLSTTVEEEKSKEEFYLEVSAREEKSSQLLRALQKDLKTEMDERQTEVAALDETIARLRREVDRVQSAAAAEVSSLEANTRTREDDEKSAFDAECGELTAHLDKLKAELGTTAQRNRDQEGILRKKKNKNEAEARRPRGWGRPGLGVTH